MHLDFLLVLEVVIYKYIDDNKYIFWSTFLTLTLALSFITGFDFQTSLRTVMSRHFGETSLPCFFHLKLLPNFYTEPWLSFPVVGLPMEASTCTGFPSLWHQLCLHSAEELLRQPGHFNSTSWCHPGLPLFADGSSSMTFSIFLVNHNLRRWFTIHYSCFQVLS